MPTSKLTPLLAAEEGSACDAKTTLAGTETNPASPSSTSGWIRKKMIELRESIRPFTSGWTREHLIELRESMQEQGCVFCSQFTSDLLHMRTLFAIALSIALSFMLVMRKCDRSYDKLCPVMPEIVLKYCVPSAEFMRWWSNTSLKWWFWGLTPLRYFLRGLTYIGFGHLPFVGTMISVLGTLKTVPPLYPTWHYDEALDKSVSPDLDPNKPNEREPFFLAIIMTQVLLMGFSATFWQMLFTKIAPKFLPDSFITKEKTLTQPRYIHTLFILYHASHHLLLFFLMNFAIVHRFMSGSSGFNWELWVVWSSIVLIVMNITAFGKYVSAIGFQFKSSTFEVMMVMMPVIGNDFNLAKEFIFSGVCFMSAQRENLPQWQAVCANTLGFVTLVLSLMLFKDVIESPTTLENFIRAHWPIVMAVPPTGFKNVSNKISFFTVLIDQSNFAKSVQAEKQSLPQGICELIYGAIFGFEGFVIVAITSTVGKVIFIRVARSRLTSYIERSCEPELVTAFAKSNGFKPVFKLPESESQAVVRGSALKFASCHRFAAEEVQTILDVWGISDFWKYSKGVDNLYNTDIAYIEYGDMALLPHLKGLDLPTAITIQGGGHESIGKDAFYLRDVAGLAHLTIDDYCKITKVGTEHLGALQSLKSLNIGGWNDIDSVAAKQFRGLTNLEVLEIGVSNNLGPEGVGEISNLIGLKKLTIGDKNRITAAGTASLSNLTNLEELVIGKFNKIEEKGAKDLAALTNLRSLKIDSGNEIGTNGVEALSTLVNLTRLEIGSSENIGKLGAKHLTNLANLTELKIGSCDDRGASTNGLETEGARHLSKLTRLTKLEIGALNKIGEEGMLYLSELRQLTHLRIAGGNELKAKGAEHVSKLKKLVMVTIGSKNEIHDEGVRYLSTLPELTELELGDLNLVGNDAVSSILDMTNLKRLTIGVKNPMKGDAKDKIMEKGVEVETIY
eukprot:TRINITY_DN73866_c0_g1_i1.p1 TRINITY_DN73866_c0_g1~~TRINITY_DN73866_c0_g1_i1.p1  ORF type:complete len:976 (+),score=144.76 TRINITY_DN73866_c0_g1_i1:54-2930(+)